MKSSVSLLGLTVENYFNLFNWQQLPPSTNKSLLPTQAKIISPQRPVVLSALTVEKFFNLCNWQLSPQLELVNNDHTETLPLLPDQNKELTPPTALPCLTVTEFFSLCNWHSLPPEIRTQLPLEQKPQEPKPPLVQQVQTFFQMIPWEGSPTIGGLPQVSSLSELIASPQTEMNLNDLSKLF